MKRVVVLCAVFLLGVALIARPTLRKTPAPSGVPKGTARTYADQLPQPIPHEAQVYAELWQVCKAKKLKYQVVCTDAFGCNAYAWDSRLSWEDARYVPEWEAHSEPPSDPTAAAVRLLAALRGEPNETPAPVKNYDAPVTTFDTGEVKP